MGCIEHFRSEHALTRVLGFGFDSQNECKRFFAERVTAKLREADGAALLHEQLVELGDTGFDTDALTKQIVAPPAQKDWEVGEAFAEAALEDYQEAKFPWPTAFDKRTPRASLPGPDLVGFHGNLQPRFLFGEAKSSSEAACPPQVIATGDDCLARQVSRLLTSSAHRQQLIAWLMVRCRGTAWEFAFEEALKRYYTSERSDAWIVGVAVRGGTNPDQNDLLRACVMIARQEQDHETTLIAFYVPFHKDHWLKLVSTT